MAKKIRFPLHMNGVDVRTIEELREHFDLESVLGYFINGKLVTWLRDHYYDNEAKAVEALSADDSELNERITSILGVCMSEDMMSININDIQRRTEKIALLRQLTDDEDLIAKVDAIAFNQEDLEDIQKNGIKEIYLCKGKFTISVNQTSFTYTNLFNPTVSFIGEDTQYVMGNRYYNGDGIKKDYKIAFELFSKSAARGNVKALVQLGVCYYYGRGTKLDYQKAIECFKKGIKVEDEKAYFWLGKCYFYGYVPDILCCCANIDGNHNCYPYNLLLAFYCFCKSKYDCITKWYMRMCYGIDYMNNFGSVGSLTLENSNWLDWHGDYRHSFKRIKEEIERINVEQMLIDLIRAGDIDAEFELGRLYFYGNADNRGIGIPRNIEEAKRLIDDAAENNQSAAQYWLAFRKITFGKDNLIVTWHSEKEKLEWCKRSYQNGCLYAAIYLWLADLSKYPFETAHFNFLSKGLLEWYTDLANSGNKFAQYVMFKLCNEKNEKMEWLKKSAENNNAEAQTRLAWELFSERNIDEAVYWYTKAIEQGNSNAAFELGLNYIAKERDNPQILPYDREKALKYLTIGAELGDKYCMGLLKDVFGIENINPINRSKIYFKEHLDVELDSIKLID